MFSHCGEAELLTGLYGNNFDSQLQGNERKNPPRSPTLSQIHVDLFFLFILVGIN